MSPSTTGALSKTNSRTAEQALSHFTVDDLLKQELLFYRPYFINGRLNFFCSAYAIDGCHSHINKLLDI